MSGSEQLENSLDGATEAIVESDYSADNKARALNYLSKLYKSAGDLDAMEQPETDRQEGHSK